MQPKPQPSPSLACVLASCCLLVVGPRYAFCMYQLPDPPWTPFPCSCHARCLLPKSATPICGSACRPLIDPPPSCIVQVRVVLAGRRRRKHSLSPPLSSRCQRPLRPPPPLPLLCLVALISLSYLSLSLSLCVCVFRSSFAHPRPSSWHLSNAAPSASGPGPLLLHHCQECTSPGPRSSHHISLPHIHTLTHTISLSPRSPMHICCLLSCGGTLMLSFRLRTRPQRRTADGSTRTRRGRRWSLCGSGSRPQPRPGTLEAAVSRSSSSLSLSLCRFLPCSSSLTAAGVRRAGSHHRPLRRAGAQQQHLVCRRGTSFHSFRLSATLLSPSRSLSHTHVSLTHVDLSLPPARLTAAVLAAATTGRHGLPLRPAAVRRLPLRVYCRGTQRNALSLELSVSLFCFDFGLCLALLAVLSRSFLIIRLPQDKAPRASASGEKVNSSIDEILAGFLDDTKKVMRQRTR